MSGITETGRSQLPLMFDLKGAARYSGLSYWSIRDLILSGRIPRVVLPTRDGTRQRRIWVLRADLDAFFTRSRERNIEPFGDSTRDSRLTVRRNTEGKAIRTADSRTADRPAPPTRRGISAETLGNETDPVTT